MSYSAIIEIVGIKELVEDDFRKFSEMTQYFKNRTEQSITEVIGKNKDSLFSIFLFRDHCYVETNKLEVLIFFIKQLRISFFKATNYFFRCVITEGELSISEAKRRKYDDKKSGSGYEIRFMEYSEISTRLYALMERYKGIGIMVDTEKLNTPHSLKILKDNVFVNFYITDIVNKKYQPYYDIRIDGSDELFSHLKNLFNRMNSDRLYSKKLVRFYIPLLINMARHYDISNDSDNEFSLDKIITKSLVTRNKDVTGFEFFYYTLIDKIFDIQYSKYIRDLGYDEQISQIEKGLAKNNWLLDLLRNDSKFSDIPKEILSNSKRRIALRRIGDLIQQNDL